MENNKKQKLLSLIPAFGIKYATYSQLSSWSYKYYQVGSVMVIITILIFCLSSIIF